MSDRNWKERILARKKFELEKRGEKVSKNARENKQFLEDSKDRGGIAVPKKADSNGNQDV